MTPSTVMRPATPARDVLSVDVLDVSDLRFAGGTSHSIAEEITAQATAGYTTALLHVDGPLVAHTTPVNPALRRHIDNGTALLTMPHQAIRSRAVVVRHPAVLQHAGRGLPLVETDRLVIVANAAPRDVDGHEHYQPDAVREAAMRVFGVEPLWAPIGPLVRSSIESGIPGHCVTEQDWVNVIDVDAWWSPRKGWVDSRPVIGRHSRSSRQKWPADTATLRAIYPTDGSWIVRILGGAEPAIEQLGAIPDTWQVHPFGAMDPRQFLAGLDFFVYYHDPRWIEAFGRTILEALATGTVAILPPHFEPLFGPAACYAEPGDVRRTIDDLYRDRNAWEAQAASAVAWVRERFGHETHVRRIRDLIGAPSSTTHLTAGRPAAVPARKKRRRRILMISSNGAGMGHLTRLLALARRCDPGIEPIFLSLSQAVPMVGKFGFHYEYIPSMRTTGLLPRRWNEYFVVRVNEIIGRSEPLAVVFDGTWPYQGIPAVRAYNRDVRWIWSRRGMWRRGQNREQLTKGHWFDLILEPGDLAAPVDRGATAAAPATRVGPVTLLDPSDLSDRLAARTALGIDRDGLVALVMLGAGNINDVEPDVDLTTAALHRLGLAAYVTNPEIARSSRRRVQVLDHYPLSEHFRAFDLAVSAAGYNSFHELLRFQVPTLFVPNQRTALDDQAARARFAADQGLAYTLDTVTVDQALPLLDDLLRRGPSMVAGVGHLDPGNGARAAMSHVEALVNEMR
jgi:hypothetical protein